jgi:hypothetical protein
MQFVIKVTTQDGAEFISQVQEIENESAFEVFKNVFIEKLGSGNLSIIDDDGDYSIIPQTIVQTSIVQIIKIK